MSVLKETVMPYRVRPQNILPVQGPQIDTTTASARLSFGIFAALAELESELIRERTMLSFQAAKRAERKENENSRCQKCA